jgi:hypothetical protein
VLTAKTDIPGHKVPLHNEARDFNGRKLELDGSQQSANYDLQARLFEYFPSKSLVKQLSRLNLATWRFPSPWIRFGI